MTTLTSVLSPINWFIIVVLQREFKFTSLKATGSGAASTAMAVPLFLKLKKTPKKIHLTVLCNMTIYFHKLAGLCSDIAAVSVQVVWIMLVS